MFIFINGKITKENKISIFDRGFMYGDGAFESLRTYNGEPFLLEDHLKRLEETCRLLKIKIKKSKLKINENIIKLMKKNNLKEAYIKLFATRGEAKGHGLSINKTKGKPLFMITVEKLNPVAKNCKAIIYSKPRSIWAGSRMKTLNYLECILARMEAEEKGAEEAIFTDTKGNILEGTTCNVFIVKNNTLITAPTSAPILAGVTRNYIIKLAKKLGIKIKEKLFKKKDLTSADEAFITSSGVEIIPLNGETGPVTKKLMEAYRAKI